MLHTSTPTPATAAQHSPLSGAETRSPSLPRILLHLEGLAVALVAVALYADQGWGWGVFFALLLAPDLAALGYLAGPVAGARSYNLVHNYVVPLALAVIGMFTDTALLVQVAAIWCVHIGVDRALGYGFKYATGFKDTHLARL